MGSFLPHRISWGGVYAPSLEDFELLAADAWAALPQEFRDLCADLIIRVSDFPEDDVLDAFDAETPFELLGLFEGIGLAHASAMPETLQPPNTIHLYRRPILDYWAEHQETLGHVVTHVLVHEIGHHFGLSDDDMEALEAEAED